MTTFTPLFETVVRGPYDFGFPGSQAGLAAANRRYPRPQSKARSTAPLPFVLEAVDEYVRLRFSADLDISRYPEVQEAARWAEATGRSVVIVLDETVRYIDSVTLSELLLFKRRLDRKDVAVATWVVNSRLYLALKMLDVAERLNAETTEERALTVLRRAHARKG